MNFISEVALNEIINHNGNLLFNYTIDGGLGVTEDNFKMFVEFTRKHNIPDEKVYFIFSDYKPGSFGIYSEDKKLVVYSKMLLASGEVGYFLFTTNDWENEEMELA